MQWNGQIWDRAEDARWRSCCWPVPVVLLLSADCSSLSIIWPSLSSFCSIFHSNISDCRLLLTIDCWLFILGIGVVFCLLLFTSPFLCSLYILFLCP
ncbi:hypothetical protein J3F84DRAFT_318954 [Trichoderma pleuroticola]